MSDVKSKKATFRLTEKVAEMLSCIAEHDKRSKTAEVEYLIERRYMEIIQKKA